MSLGRWAYKEALCNMMGHPPPPLIVMVCSTRAITCHPKQRRLFCFDVKFYGFSPEAIREAQGQTASLFLLYWTELTPDPEQEASGAFQGRWALGCRDHRRWGVTPTLEITQQIGIEM